MRRARGWSRPVLAWSALAAALAAAPPAPAQPVAPLPLAHGDVTFRFHATIVGRLVGTAPIERASFTGADLAAVQGVAELRVDRMLTGNGARDRHLREVLEAARYPAIRFDLRSVRPDSGRDTTYVTLNGDLSLHGVTRPVTAAGTVLRRGDSLEVVASFPLDMRDYGIKPPVRALILKVAPDVVVEARLVFAGPHGP